MEQDHKKYIRSIVRRVHPDLFGAHPYERNRNAESLKVLNSYVDALSSGQAVQSSIVEFWVKEDGQLVRIDAELPSHGSLGNLFYAFGVITVDELQEGLGTYDLGADSRNFLEWLKETVNEAIVAAEQHEQLKRSIRELRASIEDRFLLSAIHVGGEFAVGYAEQTRQIDALRVLESSMLQLTADQPYRFEGLNLRLYHPDSCPFDTYRFREGGPMDMNTPSMPSYVGDDGCLHIVADRNSITQSLLELDLERARLLTRLSMFWVRRVRELTPALKEMLGVENVWCDTRTEQSSQKFVLWAGYLLEAKRDFEDVLVSRRFSFSILVHSDTSAPLVDFLSSSSVLQVRSDCPPKRLLEFLSSESGSAAHQSAEAVATTKEQEEAALSAVREALGAKHVIRVCSSYEQDKVLSACERLLQHAPAIKSTVDLAGASIAIDDCYELWESGFISIPYDFEISELQPQLQKLLAAGNARAAATTSGNGDGAAEGGATATAAAAGMSEGGEDEGDAAEVVVSMDGAEFDMEQEDGYITAASRREGGAQRAVGTQAAAPRRRVVGMRVRGPLLRPGRVLLGRIAQRVPSSTVRVLGCRP